MILDSLTAIVRSYLTELNNIPAPTQEEWNREAAKCREKMLSAFSQVGLGDPFMTPINLIHTPQNVIEVIQKQSQSRYTLPYLLASTYRDRVQGDIFVTPNYLPWQIPGNKQKNFVINYSDDASKQKAINTLNQMVMTILLAFPIKKVHVTVLDLEMASDLVYLIGNLDKQLVSHVIDERGLSSLLEYLKADMLSDASTAGFTTQEEYNESQKKIEGKYELVLIPSTHGAHYARLQDTLLPFFQNAQKNGTYFLVLNDTTQSSVRPEADHILKHTDVYQLLDATTLNDFSGQETAIIKTTSFANDPTWSKVMFEYINQKANEKLAIHHDWDAMLAAPYESAVEGIQVPIGYDASGKPFMFELGIHGRYHAFIMGKTRSGKTRFMHNMLISLAMKYSPSELELYLMDFKGTEFGFYQDIKHVRTALITDRDEPVTAELFNEIRDKIEERRELFNENRVTDLIGYNRKNPDAKLPRIIVVADESQALFDPKMVQDSDLQNKWISDIEFIASKGAGFGIHLILSTQSISQAPKLSDGKITSQLSDYYILYSDVRDAKDLVPNEKQGDLTVVVPAMKPQRGECYHVCPNGNTHFTFNYVDDKDGTQERLIAECVKKAESEDSRGQVLLDGSMMFRMQKETLHTLSRKIQPDFLASPGKDVSVAQKPTQIRIRERKSENILIIGVNDEKVMGPSRVSVNLLLSLMATTSETNNDCKFLVFNCLDCDDAEYEEALQSMQLDDRCRIVSGRYQKQELYNLCQEIHSGKTSSTFLVILGQEEFEALRDNELFHDSQDEVAEENLPIDDISGMLKAMGQMNFGSSMDAPKKDIEIKTVGEAMKFILEKGPVVGVHTILQVDSPEHLLAQKNVYDESNVKFFRHQIVLKSKNEIAYKLGLSGVNIQGLDASNKRLRAYYIDGKSLKRTLFTPYMIANEQEINNLLNLE